MVDRLSVTAGAGATTQVRRFVTEFAAVRGISADDVARIMVMLEELLTNLEKYGTRAGQPGEAEIAIGLADAELTVDYSDNGVAFDPFSRTLAPLDLPLEERQVGGLGLHLLRELSHAASYRRTDGRNRILLMCRVIPAPPTSPS
ncbi:MAG TPA: ATP-binding protein [Stellaceae bacterium]|nr:ATP-binding protein [Stellaceae bacterium]